MFDNLDFCCFQVLPRELFKKLDFYLFNRQTVHKKANDTPSPQNEGKLILVFFI